MKSKFIELLAFDKHQNLQFEGKCKLKIDRLSSMLLVEPENEEFKMISAMFNWNFVIDKNFLFVFAEHESNDFVLVFKEEKRCKMVYDFIVKDTDKNVVDNALLCKRFLIPFCNSLAKSGENAKILSKIFMKWIGSHEEEERKEYIRLLKDNNVFDIVYFSTTDTKELEDVHDSEVADLNNKKKQQKRRFRSYSRSDQRCMSFDKSDIGETIPRKKHENLRFVVAVDALKYKLSAVCLQTDTPDEKRKDKKVYNFS